jgi:hypothetical protein
MNSRRPKPVLNSEAPRSSRERLALIEAAAKHARQHPAEYLTITAIELNPWNAVYQGALDLDVARAALTVTSRLAKESGAAWAAHGLATDASAAQASVAAARAWEEYAIAHGDSPGAVVALGPTRTTNVG